MAFEKGAAKPADHRDSLEQIANEFSGLIDSQEGKHGERAAHGGSLLVQAAKLGLYNGREFVIERIIIEAGMVGRLYHERPPWTTTPETQEKSNHWQTFMVIARMLRLNGKLAAGPTDEDLIQAACGWVASFIRERAEQPSEPVADPDTSRIIELTDHLGAILHQILRWRTAHAGLTIGKTLRQQQKIMNSIEEMARQSELTLLAVEAAKTRTGGIDALVHRAFGTDPGNWGWRLNRMLRQFRWFLINNSPDYPVGNDGTLMQSEFEKVQEFYLDLLDLDVNSLAPPLPRSDRHISDDELEEIRRWIPPFVTDGVTWVSNKVASDLTGLKVKSLKEYRRQGSRTADQLFGMDILSQVWQRQRSTVHPWYLRETLSTAETNRHRVL